MGNLTIRVALPHAQQDLSVLEHLEAPLAHCRLLAKAAEGSGWVGVRDPAGAGSMPTGKRRPRHRSGSLMPIIDWLDLPIPEWLYRSGR
jgi:hypothetical protein